MKKLQFIQMELDYQAHLTELLTAYIGNGDIVELLNQSLYSVATYLNIEGIFLFQFDKEKKYLINKCGWSNNGSAIVEKIVQRVTIGNHSWTINTLLRDKLLHIKNAKEIKEVAKDEYNLLKKAGISSLMANLLVVANEPWGFVVITYNKDKVSSSLIEGEIKKITVMLSASIESFLMNKEVIQLSERDPLTKIYNRYKFIDIVKEWKEPYTLFFIDIDRFKNINDTFGHEVGDIVIKEVTLAIKALLHKLNLPTHCVGRYGGDEFVLAIKVMDEEVIAEVNKALMTPITICYESIPSLSIYLCVGYKFNLEQQDIKEVIQKADYAMYYGKKQNNRQSINFKMIEEQYNIDKLVGREFEHALKNGAIYPVFQPKIIIGDKKVSSCAIRCRWKLETGQELSPKTFIPSVEKNKKNHLLDFHMFEQACMFLHKLKGLQLDHHCSVNMSLRTLFLPDFVEELMKIVDKYDVKPNQLTIELLESVFEFIDEGIKKKIRKLQKRGFKISIDDFGLENSSLSRLYSIPFNEIKIPREFMVGIDSDLTKKVFDIMLLFAKNTDSTTGIEGVETKEQVQVCINKSGDYIHGYYYSKPLCEEDYLEYLRNKSEDDNKEEDTKGVAPSLEMVSLLGILSSIPKAILLLNQDRRVLYSNKKLEQLLEIEENVIGQAFGNAYQCKYAIEQNKQCGTMEECKTCQIRMTADEVFEKKQFVGNKAFKKEFFHQNGNVLKRMDLYAVPYESDMQNMLVVVIEENNEKHIA